MGLALGLEYQCGHSLPPELLSVEIAIILDQDKAIEALLATGEVDTFLAFTEYNLGRSAQPQSLDEYVRVAESNIEFLCPGLL